MLINTIAFHQSGYSFLRIRFYYKFWSKECNFRGTLSTKIIKNFPCGGNHVAALGSNYFYPCPYLLIYRMGNNVLLDQGKTLCVE